MEPLILLSAQKIKPLLQHNEIILDIFETLDSTNTYLKAFFKQASKPHVCIAEHMTQGKGRLNRTWHAPFGKNLTLSLLYPFHQDINALHGLSLVISLAVYEALLDYLPRQQLGIKWPNDILYDGQKLCGILIEASAEKPGTCFAIIGIGINVNMLHVDEQYIHQPWTSLQKITGTYIDRNALAAKLIDQVIDYTIYFSNHGLQYFIPSWQQVDLLYGQEICLKHLDQLKNGVAKGINEKGHLLLQLHDGSIQEFSSGDTSVVKKS